MFSIKREIDRLAKDDRIEVNEVKGWYIFLLLGITFIINLVTIYNSGLAYITFFIFMQAGLPRLFIVIEKYAKRKEAEKSGPLTRFLLAYLHHIFIRITNYVSILISLTVIVFASIVVTIVQVIFKSDIQKLVFGSIFSGVDIAAQIISYVGYGFYMVALIIVCVDTVHMLRNEKLFHI